MKARNHMSMRTGLIGILFCVALFLIPACAPFATYPPDGSGPRTYPWMAPGPEVMATGLMQAHARVAPDEPFVFNLPAGVSQMAWDDVQMRLGPNARPMQPGDSVVWNLERFGVRNTKAFADIGYWKDGKGILITVSMERQNVLPFQVTHIQRWYVPMEAPMSHAPTSEDMTTTDETSGTDSSESSE